jgi:hypothetical protein
MSVPSDGASRQDSPHTNKPTKDDTDLVAAALGLRSSAWAQAVVHLVEPQFNADIGGKPYLRDGKRVDDEPAARGAGGE